jgi:hypothetical protein
LNLGFERKSQTKREKKEEIYSLFVGNAFATMNENTKAYQSKKRYYWIGA